MAKGTERENSLQRGGGGPARLWLMVVGGGGREAGGGAPPPGTAELGGTSRSGAAALVLQLVPERGGGKMGVNGGREMGGRSPQDPPPHSPMRPSLGQVHLCQVQVQLRGGTELSVHLWGGSCPPVPPHRTPPYLPQHLLPPHEGHVGFDLRLQRAPGGVLRSHVPLQPGGGDTQGAIGHTMHEDAPPAPQSPLLYRSLKSGFRVFLCTAVLRLEPRPRSGGSSSRET